MARSKQPKQIMQLTVKQFAAMFPDEAACDAYLIAHRWPNGPVCPRCGSVNVYPLKTMKISGSARTAVRVALTASRTWSARSLRTRTWICWIGSRSST